MTPENIATCLSLRMVAVAACPTDTVFAISMRNVIDEIVYRLGEKALAVSAADLLGAREAVRVSIGQYLNPKTYIATGLDAWEANMNKQVQLTPRAVQR